MLVLVINSGSSSLKYQVRDVEAGSVLAEGLVEKIGMGTGGEGDGEPVGPRDHAEALEQVDADIHAALGDRMLDAVGHRVVHGGERFSEPVLVNNEIARAIERLNPLAPLHNPANVLGIRAISKKWPEMPQVAVFDTAFHRTLPEHAWRYAVPDELYTNHGIRRYGFHGTSHEYVAHRAAALLDVPVEEFDAVIAHLGNGASVTAIRGGESVDTSMGFTPLEGLVMGTRSGDLDRPSWCSLAGRAGRRRTSIPCSTASPGSRAWPATTTCAQWSRPRKPATPRRPWPSPSPPTGSRSTSAATMWPSAGRRRSSSRPGSARTRTSSAPWSRSGSAPWACSSTPS